MSGVDGAAWRLSHSFLKAHTHALAVSSLLLYPPVPYSMDRYKKLIAFATANIEEGSPIFVDELKICKEMVELMPAQIDQMHFRGRQLG